MARLLAAVVFFRIWISSTKEENFVKENGVLDRAIRSFLLSSNITSDSRSWKMPSHRKACSEVVWNFVKMLGPMLTCRNFNRSVKYVTRWKFTA